MLFLAIIFSLVLFKISQKISFGDIFWSSVSDYHSKVNITTESHSIFGLLVMFFGTQKNYIYPIL